MNHDLARQLRRTQTDLERKLWQSLRDRRFAGFKFRCQHPIGDYVVDFVCLQARLAIELDGGQHGLAERAVADERRTAFLQSQGFRVKRFWNYELVEDSDAVLTAIWRDLQTPVPLTSEI